MRGGRSAVAVVWLVLIATAIPPRAQQPPQSSQPSQQRPSFRSGVELVSVDFSVIDAKGRPVSDLRPDEVVLKIDGQPRPISSLAFIGDTTTAASPPDDAHGGTKSSTTATDISSNTQAVEGRLIVLVVDVGHIHAGGTYVLKRA